MSKILANQIANFGDNAPIEIKEGLNIPANKPIQANGSSGTSGQVLTSTGVSISWTTPFNGDYNNLFNKPTIPSAQVNADWDATTGISRILNKPVVPPLPSVVTASASGSGGLAYNSLNGQFTFTPPNLSSYLTSYTETDPVFSASPAGTITNTNKTNWNSAYGWGDHASAGYLTSTGSINTHTDVDTVTNPPVTGQVLKWDGSQWKPGNDLTAAGTGIALTDLSVNTAAAAGGGSLSYNNTSGVFTFTPPLLSSYLTSTGSIDSHTDVTITSATTNQLLRYDGTQWVNWTPNYLTSYTETDPVFSASAAAGVTSGKITNWDSAYGWGNHASANYVADSDFTSTGLMKRGATSGTYVTVTDNSSNWDTAYSWGNHASAGYLTSTGSIDSHSDVTITSAANGQFLTYNGSQWVNTTYTPVAIASVADTAPSSPSNGSLWWESDTGRLKVYYNDTNSSQWVDASPPLQQDKIASTGAPATASSTGTAGEIRYDSGYVYICIATNTWKRAALTTW